MTFQDRIREIHYSFIMESQDRETCINLFEGLLHEYDMLPKAEQLDRWGVPDRDRPGAGSRQQSSSGHVTAP